MTNARGDGSTEDLRARFLDKATERMRTAVPSPILPRDLPLEDFFRGSQDSKAFYLSRLLQPLGTTSDAHRSSLSDLVEDWHKAPTAPGNSKPILLLGPSGTGKTTEQLKIAFDFFYNRIEAETENPVLIYLPPQVGSELGTSHANLAENIARDLGYPTESPKFSQLLSGLEPTIFFFDLNVAAELEEDRELFLEKCSNFSDEYPHHLLIIAYRTAEVLTVEGGDAILKYIIAPGQIGQAGRRFRAYRLLPLDKKQIQEFCTKIYPNAASSTHLEYVYSFEAANNPLILYLFSRLSDPESVRYRGQLYRRFLKNLFSEVSQRSGRTLPLISLQDIAVSMWDRSSLKISNKELVGILSKHSISDTQEAINDLVNFSLLKPSNGAGDPATTSYRFLHDSFALYFKARSILRWNSAGTKEKNEHAYWEMALDRMLTKDFGPRDFELFGYLPGLFAENEVGLSIGDLRNWFLDRFEISRRLLKRYTLSPKGRASSESEAGDKGQGRRVDPKDLIDLAKSIAQSTAILPEPVWAGGSILMRILPRLIRRREIFWFTRGVQADLIALAHSLSLEDPSFTNIIEMALADPTPEVRLPALERTINIIDQQLDHADFDSVTETPRGALAVLHNLAGSVESAWDRPSYYLYFDLITSFLSRRIGIGRWGPKLTARMESLSYLLIMVSGRSLGKSPRQGRSLEYLGSFAEDMLRTLIRKRGANGRPVVVSFVARFLLHHYRSKMFYPCNAFEMEISLTSADRLKNSSKAAHRDMLKEIGRLFVPQAEDFSMGRIKELCSVHNGLVAWYMSTIIAIYGDIEATQDSILDMLGEICDEGDPVSMYVGFRGLHSLVYFSKHCTRKPRAHDLFRKFADELLRNIGRTREGWKIRYGAPQISWRTYDNQVLLYYGEYLCRRDQQSRSESPDGRNVSSDFSSLFDEIMSRAEDYESFEYCLEALHYIGRKREFVGPVLEILDQIQMLPKVERSKRRCNAVANVYRRMYPFNPDVVAPEWKKCRNPRVRKQFTRRRRLTIRDLERNFQRPIAYFGNDIFQNLLLVPRGQEAFRAGAIEAADAKDVQGFLLTFIDTVADALLLEGR